MLKIPNFKFKGKQIFYQIKEAKNTKAIIFVHGSGENSNVWKGQLEGLNINFNLVAIDLPSHAKSETFQDLSLDLYVDVVSECVKSLKFESVIMCGHSLGGAVAQAFYFKYPSITSALILVGTGARLRVNPMIIDWLKNDFQGYIESIPIGAFHRRADKEIVNKVCSEISEVPAEVTLADFTICDNFDIINEVKSGEIKVPCLVVVGNADKLTPVKYSQFFVEHVKDTKLEIIRNAGHMVMLEKPIELSQAIRDFISKL